MSTTWASKIAWILSPTRSYIACMSSFSARPRWTSLISASSAARSFVSVRRRWSRRTAGRSRGRRSGWRRGSSAGGRRRRRRRPRGRGSGARSGHGPRRRRSAGQTGRTSARSPWIDDQLHPALVEPRSGRPVDRGAAPGFDDVLAEAADRDRLVREAHAALDGVREVDQSGVQVVDRRCRRPGRRRSPGSCRRRGRTSPACRASAARPSLDVVDDGQLGGSLVRLGQEALRLVEQPGVLEGDAHARGERREQALVGLVVGVLLACSRGAITPKIAVARRDRDAEPRLGCGAPTSDRPGRVQARSSDPMFSGGLRDRMTREVSPSPSAIGIVSQRSPSSIAYGKLDPVRRLVVESDVERVGVEDLERTRRPRAR